MPVVSRVRVIAAGRCLYGILSLADELRGSFVGFQLAEDLGARLAASFDDEG